MAKQEGILNKKQINALIFILFLACVWFLFYYLPKKFIKKHFAKGKIKTEKIVFVNTISPVISNKKPLGKNENFNYNVSYKNSYSKKYVKTI